MEYRWSDGDGEHVLRLIRVPGCVGAPYRFGAGESTGMREIEVREFWIADVPVTQALWVHVMGVNPAVRQGTGLPLENVSWDEITGAGGFLDRINAGPVYEAIRRQGSGRFRLPTEAEWEYAARGGPHWRDGFRLSGGNDAGAVAWYGRRHGDHTQPVRLKAANQLGLYDMSGNVWEWCEDVYTPDVSRIPADGSATTGPEEERVLRGGCFHNWAIHCTVGKRYEIGRQYHDGCIGFRLAFAQQSSRTRH